MDQERAQVGIASLRHGSKSDLATGAALARHQPEERSELASRPECLRIPHRRNQRRRGKSADARYSSDRVTRRVLLLPDAYPLLEKIDIALQLLDTSQLIL